MLIASAAQKGTVRTPESELRQYVCTESDFFFSKDSESEFFRSTVVLHAKRRLTSDGTIPWMLGLGRHRARAHTLVRFLFRLGRRT